MAEGACGEPTLDALTANIAGARGGQLPVVVRDVHHDSRRVQAGDVFVALSGTQQDGVQFARDAIGRGAVAVVAERPLSLPVPVVVVPDGLLALAEMARRRYGDPTAALPVVGVTGTNGKTTCAYLIEQGLHALGRTPAVVGTINFRGPFGELPATHTTPMADDLMRLARRAVDSGATELVLEVSSHGLAMRRVDGVTFDVVAFTNLSQDHLDYHADFENYAAAKGRLFRDFDSRVGVLNIDDACGRRFAADYRGRLLRTSRDAVAAAELRVLSLRHDRRGLSLRIATPDGEVGIDSGLLGLHNADNLLTALGCLIGLGHAAADAAAALATAGGAPGRLQRVPHPRDVLVFVDYAHTPDAVDKAALACAELTSGRLITLFGCGGDRDRGKRPRMAQAAAARSDLVVVTSDNPRREAPEAILADIVPGFADTGMSEVPATALSATGRGFAVVTDRRAAISAAVAACRPGDTLLIAGKGHERVQIIGSERLPFDDVAVARQAIAAVGEGA